MAYLRSKEPVAGRDVLVGEHSIRHRYHIDWLLWLLHSIDNHWYWCTTIVVLTLGYLRSPFMRSYRLGPRLQRNGEVLWSSVPLTLKAEGTFAQFYPQCHDWHDRVGMICNFCRRRIAFLDTSLLKYAISIHINLTDLTPLNLSISSGLTSVYLFLLKFSLLTIDSLL